MAEAVKNPTVLEALADSNNCPKWAEFGSDCKYAWAISTRLRYWNGNRVDSDIAESVLHSKFGFATKGMIEPIEVGDKKHTAFASLAHESWIKVVGEGEITFYNSQNGHERFYLREEGGMIVVDIEIGEPEEDNNVVVGFGKKPQQDRQCPPIRRSPRLVAMTGV